MLDHVSISASNFDKSKAFYTALLAPLGIGLLMEFPGTAGFGRDGAPGFWIGTGAAGARGGHVAFRAPSQEAVRRFHEEGLKAGGKDEGRPGLRPQYHPHYYAAFLWDPDGFKVEAVTHTAE